jgi:hypothetical protein
MLCRESEDELVDRSCLLSMSAYNDLRALLADRLDTARCRLFDIDQCGTSLHVFCEESFEVVIMNSRCSVNVGTLAYGCWSCAQIICHASTTGTEGPTKWFDVQIVGEAVRVVSCGSSDSDCTIKLQAAEVVPALLLTFIVMWL